MRKWLIRLGILLGIILSSLVVLFLAFHEARPQAKANKQGDLLAQEMLDALQASSWDTTRFVRWSFPGDRHYFWDKQNDLVEVHWQKNRVLLHTMSLQAQVYQNGQSLEGKKATRLKEKAWEMFCNDSFWLCAPYKVFDPGTERALLDLDAPEKGLLVTFSGGGVNPGDTYLWILDENNIPKAFKMWVKILPIGGVEARWTNWKATSTGAILAQQRQIGTRISINIENLQTGNDLANFEIEKSPFKDFSLNLQQESNF